MRFGQFDGEVAIVIHRAFANHVTVGIRDGDFASRFTFAGDGGAVTTHFNVGRRIRRGAVRRGDLAGFGLIARLVGQADIEFLAINLRLAQLDFKIAFRVGLSFTDDVTVGITHGDRGPWLTSTRHHTPIPTDRQIRGSIGCHIVAAGSAGTGAGRRVTDQECCRRATNRQRRQSPVPASRSGLGKTDAARAIGLAKPENTFVIKKLKFVGRLFTFIGGIEIGDGDLLTILEGNDKIVTHPAGEIDLFRAEGHLNHIAATHERHNVTPRCLRNGAAGFINDGNDLIGHFPTPSERTLRIVFLRNRCVSQ